MAPIINVEGNRDDIKDVCVSHANHFHQILIWVGAVDEDDYKAKNTFINLLGISS